MLVVDRVVELRKLNAPACFLTVFLYVIVVVSTLTIKYCAVAGWTTLWRGKRVCQLRSVLRVSASRLAGQRYRSTYAQGSLCFARCVVPLSLGELYRTSMCSVSEQTLRRTLAPR